jgi:hypothetical protein
MRRGNDLAGPKGRLSHILALYRSIACYNAWHEEAD